MSTGGDTRGLALLIGAMYATDLFSAFMSSPWSTEAFGADAARAASARRLVMISVVSAVSAGAVASYLDHNWWPLVGTSAAALGMYVLYEQALSKGARAGYTGVDLSKS